MGVNALAGIFLAALTYIHHGDPGLYLSMPLSLMRETQRAGLAYSLFALMLGIGGLMVRAAIAAGRVTEACLYALATLALAVAAVTDTWSLPHALAAMALTILMCHLVAKLIVSDEGRGLRIYSACAAVPLLWAAWLGYGVGQKAAMVYFVLAMTLRHRDLWRIRETERLGATPRWRAHWRCTVATSSAETSAKSDLAS